MLRARPCSLEVIFVNFLDKQWIWSDKAATYVKSQLCCTLVNQDSQFPSLLYSLGWKSIVIIPTKPVINIMKIFTLIETLKLSLQLLLVMLPVSCWHVTMSEGVSYMSIRVASRCCHLMWKLKQTDSSIIKLKQNWGLDTFEGSLPHDTQCTDPYALILQTNTWW